MIEFSNIDDECTDRTVENRPTRLCEIQGLKNI